MENNIKYKNKKNGTEKAEDQYRLTVMREAGEAVRSIVEKVNDGFVAGQVTRAQVASWALIKQAKLMSADDIKEIRAEYFDEIAMLDLLLRRAKQTGILAPEIKALLKAQLEVPLQSKKNMKKNLKEPITNDDLEINDGNRAKEVAREAGIDS